MSLHKTYYTTTECNNTPYKCKKEVLGYLRNNGMILFCTGLNRANPEKDDDEIQH
jgi:hypothetical protein